MTLPVFISHNNESSMKAEITAAWFTAEFPAMAKSLS